MARRIIPKENVELKVGGKYWAGKQVEQIPPKFEFRFEIVEVIENAIARARCLKAPYNQQGMLEQVVAFSYKDAKKTFK